MEQVNWSRFCRPRNCIQDMTRECLLPVMARTANMDKQYINQYTTSVYD